jgi:shikimate kinase
MLALSGFQGSGKTHMGKIVAKRLHLPFYDVDDHLGTNPRNLYRELGEEGFRKKERQAIDALLQQEVGVLALGGGSFTHEDVAQNVFQKCFVIFLERSYEQLVEEIRKNSPAYLDAKDPIGSFDRIYQKRYEQYRRYAHATISCEEEDLEEKIINFYGMRLLSKCALPWKN